MANFVKTKITVSVICVGIMLLVSSLYSNFKASPSFTRWGDPITWDNFEGVPRVFSKYAAGISSTIYLKYDSSTKQYFAYAAQNNNYSWAKPGIKDSAHWYLLNHEQYHFNITEVHARMLNAFMRENPDADELDYNRKFNQFKIELEQMQDVYDNETDHSLNRDLQRWWEYKVDSLLQVYAGDVGRVIDYYSGASVWFPIKPQMGSGINKNSVAYRYMAVSGYDMQLRLVTYQQEDYEADSSSLKGYAKQIYQNLGLTERFFTVHLEQGDYIIRAIVYDTSSRQTIYDLWSVRDSYLYRVSADINRQGNDSVGYQRIAKSFINSFSFIDTDAHWVSKLEHDTAQVFIQDMQLTKHNKPTTENCYTILHGTRRGFYRGPIRDKNRWIIAYDILDQPDSLIQEHALYASSKLVTFRDSEADILYVFRETDQTIPTTSFAVGYILRNDTTQGCKPIYNQTIQIRESSIEE